MRLGPPGGPQISISAILGRVNCFMFGYFLLPKQKVAKPRTGAVLRIAKVRPKRDPWSLGRAFVFRLARAMESLWRMKCASGRPLRLTRAINFLG